MKQSFLRWLTISAALGLLAPIVWFTTLGYAGSFLEIYPLFRLLRAIWPSSIWLMATDGIEGSPTGYMFISMAIAANVILYAVLGSAAWYFKRLMDAKK